MTMQEAKQRFQCVDLSQFLPELRAAVREADKLDRAQAAGERTPAATVGKCE